MGGADYMKEALPTPEKKPEPAVTPAQTPEPEKK